MGVPTANPVGEDGAHTAALASWEGMGGPRILPLQVPIGALVQGLKPYRSHAAVCLGTPDCPHWALLLGGHYDVRVTRAVGVGGFKVKPIP